MAVLLLGCERPPRIEASLNTQSEILRETVSQENLPFEEDLPGWLKRVQATFDADKLNKEFPRIAFIATVVEIRERKSDDIFVGDQNDRDSEVAVLRLGRVGVEIDPRLRESATIVCPVGKSKALWHLWLFQNVEQLFECSKLGRGEVVFKFGC